MFNELRVGGRKTRWEDPSHQLKAGAGRERTHSRLSSMELEVRLGVCFGREEGEVKLCSWP